MNYEIIKISDNETVIKGTAADGTVWWIPLDEENTMYQAYLEWKAAQ